MIHIPFVAKSDQGAPLQRCIERAAQQTGKTPFEVVKIMSFLFERFENELCMGKSIRVPGFGIISPVAVESSTAGEPVRCFPRFVPARALANEIFSSSFADPKAVYPLYRKQRSESPNSNSPKPCKELTVNEKKIAAAMEQARRNLEAILRQG